MKIKKLHYLVIVAISWHEACGVSLVYSLKIRRVIKTSAILGETEKRKTAVTALPVFYKRHRTFLDEPRHINFSEKRFIGGSLFNVRVVSPKALWWGEVTTGVENEHFKTQGTLNLTGSRTGFDDVVLSAGRNWFPNKKTQGVFYAIGGFPTDFKVAPLDINDTLVGTRFFSAGFGSEFSYDFVNAARQSCILVFQNRFLHFFERSWPFPTIGSKVQPGNVTDVLLSLVYRIKRTVFEGGYNPTFITNQAIVTSNQTIKAPAYIRQSGYINFLHLIKQCPGFNVPIIIGAGFSGATANLFKTRILTGWLTLTAIF
jgi:hypothetical protein